MNKTNERLTLPCIPIPTTEPPEPGYIDLGVGTNKRIFAIDETGNQINLFPEGAIFSTDPVLVTDRVLVDSDKLGGFLPSHYVTIDQVGAPEGVVPLDATGKVSSTYLPSLSFLPTANIKMGSSTFQGSTGVSISHNFGSIPSGVSITPSVATAGNLGEFYFTATTTAITVYNTGSAGYTFSYIIIK
jgi:hypothetical protein